MTDLATLGFAVDSRPLAQATADLKAMVPAAREVGAAVDGMVNAVNKAKPAAAGTNRSRHRMVRRCTPRTTLTRNVAVWSGFGWILLDER